MYEVDPNAGPQAPEEMVAVQHNLETVPVDTPPVLERFAPSKSLRIPSVGRMSRIRLYTQYLPGDMDKIAYKDTWDTGQDAIAAHQLMEWCRAYRKLTELAIHTDSLSAFEMWKVLAQTFNQSSEQVF